MTRRPRFAAALPLTIGFSLVASAALAIDGPVADRSAALDARTINLPTMVPVVDPNQQEVLRREPAWQRFLADYGNWRVDFELESGRPRRMLGEGIPLIPGAFNSLTLGDLPTPSAGPLAELTDEVLEATAKRFLGLHDDLFRLRLDEWQLDRSGTQANPRVSTQIIALTRSIDGIPIGGARVTLALKGGNLTYLHATFTDDFAILTVPLVTPETAMQVATGGLDGIVEVTRAPHLSIEPIAAPGGGRTFHLAWSVRFRVPETIGNWETLVDAHTGQLLSLADANAYACNLDPTRVQGRVEGGVRPARATDAEELRYFPLTDLVDNAAPETTDFNGWYFYSGYLAQSTLSGKYFDVFCDGCTGQPSASSTTDGYIDFGFGGVNQTWNGFSTPADRTAYYHLTVARSMGAKWLTRTWLDSTVGVNVNIPSTCNAFWDGATVNFFRSGGGCANTGEIRDVMQHEWGHGLDANDGVPPVAADRATGEFIGDMIALFVDHDSCVGQSFQVGRNTGPYCTTIPACSAPTPTCDGVRNIDEKRSTRTLATIDRVRNPPRVCGAISCAGCVGPVCAECHCEGEIPGQANFHLIFNLLTGTDYDTGAPIPGANPAFPEPAAWFIHERMFFVGLSLMQSYAPSSQQSLGTSMYDAYAFADDDDGNLANGTPNMAYINNAFQHHGVQESPLDIDAANCTPPADPNPTLLALVSTTGRSQVEVSWTGDPTANFYNVYRTDRIGDVWLPVRENILEDGSGGPWIVYDEPVRNSATYYYSVLAIGTTGCVSGGANAKSITVALPEVEISSQSINDTIGGDGDGNPEPGETIRLTINLAEVAGFVAAGNVSARLTTIDPLITIAIPGPIVYGTIAPSGVRPGPTPFEFYIAVSHGCNTPIPFSLLIESDDGCWLRALKVVVPPSPPCTVAPAAEAAYLSAAVTVDNIDPTCTDGDGIPDNGETARLQVNVRNAGTLTANNVNVTLLTASPFISIVSANPATLAAPLAGGASNSVTFDVAVSGAPCNSTATFNASVDSDENVAPVAGNFTLPLEENQTLSSENINFESGLGAWTATAFSISSTRSTGAGTRSGWAGTTPAAGHCDGSGSADGANICATLTSPPMIPTAASRMVFDVWYRIEDVSGGQAWDRANVHVIRPGGIHQLLTPIAGRAYSGGSGDSTALCHINREAGWAGAGATWASTTFDLGPFAGQLVQVEINYNTDDLEICEGIYVDNIAINGLVSKTCDTNVCSNPIVTVETCTHADDCTVSGPDGEVEPGDSVTYTVRFRNSGLTVSNNFQADVAVTGGTIVSGGTVGGAPRVDIAAGGFHDHTIVVNVSGACGTTLSVDLINLRDATGTFPNNTSACDVPITGTPCTPCAVLTAPNVVVSLCAGADICPASGAGNGVPDPGDRVTYTVSLRNAGDAAANDVRGTITVAGGGTIVSGATIGGAPRVDIAVGATYNHLVVVNVAGLCGTTLDVDVENLVAGTYAFGDNLTACDLGIGINNPAGTFPFTDSLAIPEGIPEPGDFVPVLVRTLNMNIAAIMTGARVSVDVNHGRPSDLAATLIGPLGGSINVNGAIDATPFNVTAFVNVEGAGTYTLVLRDTIRGKAGTLASWTLAVDAPAFSSCSDCTGTCTAPVLAGISQDKTDICPDTLVTFVANFTTPGGGGFTYTWNFGDGSPPLVVTDPLVPVGHQFDGLLASYTITFTATSLSGPSCNAVTSTIVNVPPDVAPTGTIGNVLRMTRQAAGASFGWTGSTVTPKRFILLVTYSKLELADTPTGIGDEAVQTLTTLETFTAPFLKVPGPIGYFEVHPRSTCGVTSFP